MPSLALLSFALAWLGLPRLGLTCLTLPCLIRLVLFFSAMNASRARPNGTPEQPRCSVKAMQHAAVMAILSRVMTLLMSMSFTAVSNLPYDSSLEVLHFASGATCPESSEKCPEASREAFGCMCHWDCLYFTHIARYGYTHEKFYAFFPLYPLCIRALSSVTSLSYVTSAFWISNISFVVASVLLLQLTLDVTRQNRSFAEHTVAIWCFLNPASVFFSSGYTESLYATLSFAGFLLLVRVSTMCNPSTRTAPVAKTVLWLKQRACEYGASVCFTLAAATRSNGAVLLLFLVFHGLTQWYFQMMDRFKTPHSPEKGSQARPTAGDIHAMAGRGGGDSISARWSFVALVLWGGLQDLFYTSWMVLLVLQIVVPNVVFQGWAYMQYCPQYPSNVFGSTLQIIYAYAAEHYLAPSMVAFPSPASLPDESVICDLGHHECLTGYQISSDETGGGAMWCRTTIPSVYAHVQSGYWGNGLFRFYEVAQIPNFLLAFPMLVCAFCGTLGYVIVQKRMWWGVSSHDSGAPLERKLQRFNPSRLSLEAFQRKEPSSGHRSGALMYFNNPFVLIHVLHLGILCTICMLGMHVQVITRFLSACPAIFWFLAVALSPPKAIGIVEENSLYAGIVWLCGGGNGAKRTILSYLLAFNILGPLLFSNFLPWT